MEEQEKLQLQRIQDWGEKQLGIAIAEGQDPSLRRNLETDHSPYGFQ